MKYLLPLLGAIFVSAQQPPPNPVPPPKPLTLAPLGPPPLTVPPETVVLTVGDQKITKAQFEQIMANLSDQQRAQLQTPAGRRRLAESLAELTLLAEEGHNRKLDQNPKVQAQIKLQSEQVLAQAAFQDLANTATPDDALIRSFYDAHKQEYEEVKVKHILIRFKGSTVPIKTGGKDLSDEEALAKVKELRAKIAAGAKFEDVAKAESDDTGTAPQGGDLGPAFPRGRMVPAFEKVAFEAKVGELTEPVKTQFGYHIMVVEQHNTKTFEQAKPEIEQKIKPQLAQQALADLKKKVNIVYDDAYFGAPPPAPAKPPSLGK